jgi:hypothetical protein
MEVCGELHFSAVLSTGEKAHGTLLIGDSMGFRVNMDAVEGGKMCYL